VKSIAGLPRPARGSVSMFTGVHILEPVLLDRLPPGVRTRCAQLYVPLIAEGRPPLGVRVRGPWYDLGSPSLYLASQQSLLASRFRGIRRGSVIHPEARVHPRARVVRSVVGKGSVIAEGAEVRGSVLWDRVKVGRDAVVESSILAAGSAGRGRRGLRRALLMKGQPLAELRVVSSERRTESRSTRPRRGRRAPERPPAPPAVPRSRLPRRSHARPARVRLPRRALRRAVRDCACIALSGDASTRRYYRLIDGDEHSVVSLNPEPFDPDICPSS
jgi:hypothetical protein